MTVREPREGDLEDRDGSLQVHDGRFSASVWSRWESPGPRENAWPSGAPVRGLASRVINIVEEMSGYTDTIFLLEWRDMTRAMEVLAQNLQ